LHYGVLAPAGTPKDIVDRLNAELRKMVNTEDVRKRIHAEGGDPMTSTPAEYAADIDREEKKWGGLVKRLGLKVECRRKTIFHSFLQAATQNYPSPSRSSGAGLPRASM